MKFIYRSVGPPDIVQLFPHNVENLICIFIGSMIPDLVNIQTGREAQRQGNCTLHAECEKIFDYLY